MNIKLRIKHAMEALFTFDFATIKAISMHRNWPLRSTMHIPVADSAGTAVHFGITERPPLTNVF